MMMMALLLTVAGMKEKRLNHGTLLHALCRTTTTTIPFYQLCESQVTVCIRDTGLISMGVVGVVGFA